MNKGLMVPFMQAAHAGCQGVQDTDQLLNMVFVSIPQGLLLYRPYLIHQAACAQLNRFRCLWARQGRASQAGAAEVLLKLSYVL